MPVGAMLPVPKGIVPVGYLELDGSVKSIATYPDLAAYLGTTFNKGDEGAGNFRLPDSRGEFLRGWDHGRGVDAGRVIGSYQLDALQNMTGTIDGNLDIKTSTGVFALGNNVGVPSSANATTGYHSANFDASRVARTSTETRPRNLAVMWCIKAWSAPVNQGQIDVAALAAELEKMKSAVPVGALMPFPAGVVPPGYLEADGSLFLDALYPDLAAYLKKTYNLAGDAVGSTRLPDTRGEFLRGWDHGRGVDAGRAIGSFQAEEIKEHMHYMGAKYAGGSGTSVAATVQLGFSGQPDTNSKTAGVEALNGDALGGAENRPRNLAVMWCIKAWNTPVNQGTIDVAALAPLALQATEVDQGTARIATQALTDAGADDATIVTPKKLRWGFSIMKGQNGCIAFPSWLGGLVIQWMTSNTGQISAGSAETVTAPWPMAFPNACWHAIGSTGQSSNGNGFATCRIDGAFTNSVTSSTFAHITGWVSRKIFAIGN
ncbi:hypothetical protein C1893_23490 [Pseudomonas sp. MPR-ANC1]|nr:hypothetical protein C1893_23490 [Pseudomonas sp. MPR-ANC1]